MASWSRLPRTGLAQPLREGAARDALRRAVSEAGLTSCQVFGDGMTVQVDNSDFEPDVPLRRGPLLSGDAIKISDPLVLVEVLSLDRGTGDRATTLRACFKLPLVRHYLIVRPEEQRIVHHARMPDDRVDQTDNASKLSPLVSGNIVTVTRMPIALTIAATISAAARPPQLIRMGNRNTPMKPPILPAAAAMPCPVVRPCTGKISAG